MSALLGTVPRVFNSLIYDRLPRVMTSDPLKRIAVLTYFYLLTVQIMVRRLFRLGESEAGERSAARSGVPRHNRHAFR